MITADDFSANDPNKILKSYFVFIWSKKRNIFLFGILGLVLGFFYAFQSKPRFYGRLIFLLNEAKSASANPLNLLAGQLGLSQVSAGATEDRIFYLSTTKRILGNALLTEYEKDLTLADQFIRLKNLKSKWEKDTALAKFEKFNARDIDQLSFAENKIMDGLMGEFIQSNKLNIESYKKKSSTFVGSTNSGIMLIGFENENEEMSRRLPIAIYEQLARFYSQTVTKSLQQNYDLIERREDSLKTVLRELEYETAGALDEGFNVIRFKGKVREGRLKRDLEIVNLMYAEVVKNKEIAKFNLEQEKPVFQLIDQPMLPLEIVKKSKPIYAMLGFSGFFMLISFIYTALFIRKHFTFF